MGQPLLLWPPFAANLAFELWKGRPHEELDDGGSGEEGAGAGVGGASQPGGNDGQQQQQQRGLQHGPAGEEGWWVRVLYNHQPLAIPHVTGRGGLAALGAMRRLLTPYAVQQSALQATCSMDAQPRQRPVATS